MLRGPFGLSLIHLVATAAIAVAQYHLLEVRVAGNQQLRAEDIIAASRLRTGQTVARAEFDAATQRLFDTGLFASVNYTYAQKNDATGYLLTFQVAEEPAGTQVLIDIPGVDDARLWQDLARAAPFVRPRMPQNDRAVAYYQHAIETWLRQSGRRDQIVMKDETDLGRGTMFVVFLPASLPKIGEVVFSGNQVLDNAALQRAIIAVAPGQEYTDRLFRRMLELNLRPLYEEKGRLTVSFPRVAIANPAAGTSTVTAEINEGPAWTLGKVELTGDGLPAAEMKKAARFPEGKLANWKEILECIASMERVLRREGYLHVFSKPVRTFHESGNIVDVTVQVRKGQQFLFAGLQINGFSPELEQKARKLWKLQESAPMDELYVSEYIRSMLEALRIQVKSINSGMHVRPGTNLVDVALTFR
jgi:outer membrane protein insertion porin family